MSRVVALPDHGRLVVATDLQGNLRDFEQLERKFEAAAERPGGAVLVVTGDLVHGPEIPEDHWPEYLGSYYRADSRALLEAARALAERHPGRVHYLVGNHEHAHIGGPVVSKFFPNEALRLEQMLGPRLSREVRLWMKNWPLVAVARHAGLLMLHAAPNAHVDSAADIERVGFLDRRADHVFAEELLAEILWARTTTTRRARAFLRAVDPNLRVAVFGHDVVREGYASEREPLLCVSTSFGCFDGDKLYLEWDLAERAKSARDVAERGLRPLFDEEERVFRRPLRWER